MFSQIFLLGTARALEDWRAPRFALPGKWGGAQIVLSGEHTVFVRVSLKGVPFWKWAEFARLQCEAITPFAQPGAFAQFDRHGVNLWVWDRAFVQDAVSRSGQKLDASRCIPIGALCRAKSDGVWAVAPAGVRAQTTDVQFWRHGRLKASVVIPNEQAAQTWALLGQHDPLFRAAGWPAQLPDLSRRQLQPCRRAPFIGAHWPYARNNSDRSLATLASAGFASLVLCASLAWVGYWGARAYVVDRQLAESRQPQGVDVERLATDDEKRRIEFERGYEKLRQTAGLMSGVPTLAVLEQLGSITTRQGMLVREVEVGGDFVKATLVPSPGASPRLEGVVNSIEAAKGFRDARLVDVSGQGAFQFEWRYDAFSFLPAGGR